MKKKVLLADDDGSVRQMVARVLESAGYTAVLAANGQEAAARFRGARPDVVLLDLDLPEGQSWATFDQISQMDAMVPVIVLTGWPNQYKAALERGVDALMEKPLDLPLLLETIRHLAAEPEEQRVRRLTDRNFRTEYLGHKEAQPVA